MNTVKLEKIAKLIRYYILISTTEAGSGHPTSSLSATELMTALLFGSIFNTDLDNPELPNNDRLIFSKGHAAPLLYSLYAAAGKVSEKELKNLRKFGSKLQGHPTPSFPYAEVATGSLGQGLSIGVGMALNAKYIDKLPYLTYVLLGDGEMSEGSQYEAMQIAAHYKLNNLVGILDANRLGQSKETMLGHNLEVYQKRIQSFGWNTFTVDGHSFPQIINAYKEAKQSKKPSMIIAKTIKGKGISIFEDKDGWHGKVLNKEQLQEALSELGPVDKTICPLMTKPKNKIPAKVKIRSVKKENYKLGEKIATRKAYGQTLVGLSKDYPNLVVLDAEVSNSTYTELFRKAQPERFFEMYIAEQNMVGTALGLARRGKIPFVSTFAAFLSRAYDQTRLSQYSGKFANIKLAGSHAGVSIGQDGPSQMGLADIALYRSIHNSVVFYPADAIATQKIVEEAAKHVGIVYIRLTRMQTPVIYKNQESFKIGKSKILKQSDNDDITVVAAGVTIVEALGAYNILKKEGINIRVIDNYCVKPLDKDTLLKASKETRAIIVVEDHYKAGGIGEAVMSALSSKAVPIYSLAVKKMPKSGKPRELLEYEEISKDAIVKKVKEIIETEIKPEPEVISTN